LSIENESNISDLYNIKADLASPALTGNPTAPTQNANDDSTKIATTAYVDAVTSPNNKGFFATESALTTAYSTGQNGWFAIVGATDTFWLWDSDTTSWVNTGTSSQGTVSSVNITGGTGITPSGGPVTTSGSITVALDSATQATLAKVAVNETSVSTLSSSITTNTANITTNIAGIASLATAVNSNATAITANTANISSNADDIAGNSTDILSNTNDIGANEADIATNTSAIAANTSNIATNTGNIATNTANASTNSSAILANTANITTNATNISTTAYSVAMNVANIATANTNIAGKASRNAPTFTGIVKADTLYHDVHEVLNLQDHTLHSNDGTEIFNFIDKEELIFNPTTRLGVGGTADSTTKLRVVGTTRVDGAFKVNANYAGSFYDTILEVDPSTNKLVTIKNAKVTGNSLLEGPVGIGGGITNPSGVLDINGNAYISDGYSLQGATTFLGFGENNAKLTLGSINPNAIKVETVDAASTTVFNVNASTASPLVTMVNAKVDGDLQIDDDLTIDGTTTCANNVIVNNGDITVSDTSGDGTGGNVIAKDVTANNKLHVKEIQAIGSTGSTTQPIVYDSMEHRFRDFDANPTNLMVIQKFNGYTGSRIGINKNPSSTNPVTLEIVAGKNNSTDEIDEALRVIGRSFFNESIRLGHYSDVTRPTSSSTPVAQNGMIIYNSDHNEFQGFQAGTGWVKFSTEAVSI